MLIHEFIANALRDVRRGMTAGSESGGGAPVAVELDFPVSIVLSRSEPGESTLQVPTELPEPSSVSRVRVSITLDSTPKA